MSGWAVLAEVGIAIFLSLVGGLIFGIYKIVKFIQAENRKRKELKNFSKFLDSQKEKSSIWIEKGD